MKKIGVSIQNGLLAEVSYAAGATIDGRLTEAKALRAEKPACKIAFLCEFTAPEGYRFKGWQWNGEMKQPGDAVYLDSVRKAVAVWEQLPENPTEGSTAATQPQETIAPAEPQNTEPATEPEATEKVEAKDPAENNNKVWIYVSIALGVVVVGMAIAIVLLLKKK